MSKRFGRKQKRASQQRIAELEARLRKESIHHLYIPHGDEEEIDFDRITGFHETVSAQEGDQVRRELEIEVWNIDYALVERIYHDQIPVTYRGVRYVCKGCEIQRPYENPLQARRLTPDFSLDLRTRLSFVAIA